MAQDNAYKHSLIVTCFEEDDNNDVDSYKKIEERSRPITRAYLLICFSFVKLVSMLGIHTEETRRERDTCTPMFIAALFIIARTWKQPRCPSADEWIRKLWYIYTMEYYSAINTVT